MHPNGASELETTEVHKTLGVVLKNQEDISVVEALVNDPSYQ